MPYLLVDPRCKAKHVLVVVMNTAISTQCGIHATLATQSVGNRAIIVYLSTSPVQGPYAELGGIFRSIS